MQVILRYIILFVSLFASATASAQVFDSGPSDSALFTNVFDLPGDTLPADNAVGVFGETTQVNIPSGTAVGDFFNAASGSEVNITGGSVGNVFNIFFGEVNISGGSVGINFRPSSTQINISGGSVGENFFTQGGEVNLSSGSVGDNITTFFGEINISGGSFGNDFDVQGSQVNVSGGSIGNGMRAFRDSEVSISGGFVGDDCIAEFGSEVNISGGSVGENFDALSFSDVNISGGSVGAGFDAFGLSQIKISGGSVGDGFRALDESLVIISGGSIGNFTAEDGSTVSLLGSDFAIDGVLMDDLVPGQPFTILDRDMTLSGLLEDGSAFSFDLNSESAPAQDSFESGATLIVKLPPVLRGDVNQDGTVDFLDIVPFVSVFSSGDFLAEADVNRDEVVNGLDIRPFVRLLAGASPIAVPGTIRVRLQQLDYIFIEGFEIGLRFETTDGTVIDSTLWSDFVLSQNPNPKIADVYDSVLEQSVPAGDIVVFAEVLISPGTKIVPPDLDGPLPCRLHVAVPEDGQIDVEVFFVPANCLRLR